jgi:hypothetical protein
MDKDLLEFLLVVLLSALKMGVGGMPMSYVFKFNLLKTIFSTTLGGCLGAIFFVNAGDKLLHLIKQWRKKNPRAPRPVFTVRNKLLVKIKRRYGLAGIALVTPLFLSYPLGCLIAIRYFHNKKLVISYLCASTAGWSIILSLLKMF